ncbi:TIGR04283 family arsenosugar biosynthesis glycosyltransferase [Candidatus Poribacteria bacterium]
MNRISIVIPVLREAERINSLVDHIHSQEFHESYEIIVVDGDPDGTTINAIQHEEIKTMTSAKGRARQMNAGAGIAEGEILFFLHADTLLPDNGLHKISSAMEDKQYVAGAFNLGMDTNSLALKIIVYIASRRSRLSRIPYGDQGIFIRRDYFNRIGCYKDIPLMEDVELMRRIKKMGDKIHIIPDRVSTSARRWEEEGVARCSARNIIIATLYCMGVSPETLVRYYRRRRNVHRNG